MQRTLLIGHAGVSWKEWLKENRGDQPFICLDPAEPSQSPPGRLCLTVGERVHGWRFYGSLDAQRAPHIIVTALAKLLEQCPGEPIVQFPPYWQIPLLRQTLQAVSEILSPDRIVVAEGTSLDLNGFPVGPEVVKLEQAFPPVVVKAQRKAQWIKLADEASTHTLEMDRVTFEGSRLGSGTPVTAEELRKIGVPELLYVETMGTTVLVVGKGDLEEEALTKIADHFEAHRTVVVSPESYWGLLCSFARENGEDFGFGFIERIDFGARTIQVRNTAELGAGVRIVRIGGFRLDSAGAELGEVKPWQV